VQQVVVDDAVAVRNLPKLVARLQPLARLVHVGVAGRGREQEDVEAHQVHEEELHLGAGGELLRGIARGVERGVVAVVGAAGQAVERDLVAAVQLLVPPQPLVEGRRGQARVAPGATADGHARGRRGERLHDVVGQRQVVGGGDKVLLGRGDLLQFFVV
jgi:hypothetical protein